jgi:hypothetical protein
LAALDSAQSREGGAKIASLQGMANLTLAPEDDDSFSDSPHNLGASLREHLAEQELSTEMQRVGGRFDLQKVGFGIIDPWPGTVPQPGPEDDAGTGPFEGAE